MTRELLAAPSWVLTWLPRTGSSGTQMGWIVSPLVARVRGGGGSISVLFCLGRHKKKVETKIAIYSLPRDGLADGEACDGSLNPLLFLVGARDSQARDRTVFLTTCPSPWRGVSRQLHLRSPPPQASEEAKPEFRVAAACLDFGFPPQRLRHVPGSWRSCLGRSVVHLLVYRPTIQQ